MFRTGPWTAPAHGRLARPDRRGRARLASAVLNGRGFNKDSVKTGEVVTVVGNPARARPAAFMLGRELYKRDGSCAHPSARPC